jgi:pyruvate carboxylase
MSTPRPSSSTAPSGSAGPARPDRAIRRLLVANRGEIAIRVFRACTELGIRAIGIYAHEDRFSLHRFKADEAYQVGELGEPVKSYLDVARILEIARRADVDAIHPGYGFLSERADFARAVRAAGMIFVGPTPETLQQVGDKVAARRAAAALPLVPGTEPLPDFEAALRAAREIGFPVMVKAAGGGGGRGIRVARDEGELAASYESARREAESAFGDDSVFLEKQVVDPKHIEVQVLADASGRVVHLYERDCSIQRRHQKVLEIAPAPNLEPGLRERLCADAVRFAAGVGYRNAGTVEFLVAGGRHYFIEMNPRIQVEHTVSEEVTGIDLVQAQIRIAQGETLEEIGIRQEEIATRGFAIQCRITTENPENRFLPDYGQINGYRSPGGLGVRLDAGSAFQGALITPYYDSLLVKLTTRGRSLREAAARSIRALGEFRVRGVETNIGFLENVLRHDTFLAGEATTGFIDAHPELLHMPQRRGGGSRLLQYISEVTVNGRSGVAKRHPGLDESHPVPPSYDLDQPPPPGTKQVFDRLGADRFVAWLGEQDRLFVTDTTFRDAHQSLIATRMRTWDMLRVAPALARLAPELFSLEMWGGATFDVAYRFLDEDPWDRLARLREAIPNVLFQMLLRGANAVGYTTYPDNVVRRFVREAAACGIDLFRIFDSLNWIEQMTVAIEAVREAGAIAEAAVCYTGDLLDPSRDRYTLGYYVKLAKELVARGAHVIAIKDMSGLLKPYAAEKLVRALKDETGVPIHLHTHDTAGIQAATLLKAAEMGVDVVDCAFGPFSGSTSQPNLESVVAMMEHTKRPTGLDLAKLLEFGSYWQAVRASYDVFDGAPKTSSADVYEHEIPGGQYTNLREQAIALGLGDRWREVTRTYRTVNDMFGDIVKVTPSSKIVGDMALYMVSNGLSAEEVLRKGDELSFPESVVEFFQGRIGVPSYGFPEPLRSLVLKGRPAVHGRPGADLPDVDFDAKSEELRKKIGRAPAIREVLAYVLYPKVFLDYVAQHEKHGDVSVLPTSTFLHGMTPGEEIHVHLGQGRTVVIRLVAVSEPDVEGRRGVFLEMNGQPRRLFVQDRSLGIVKHENAKANPDDPTQIGAPLPGLVVNFLRKEGERVTRGERLAVIEAMKMESNVEAPMDATIAKIVLAPGSRVEAGDLLLVLKPAEA